MGTIYYKIKDDRVDHKGERYFRFDPSRPKVCQITVRAGELPRGRNNCTGIYFIDATYFLSNFLLYYIEPISRDLFDEKFEMVIEVLKAT